MWGELPDDVFAELTSPEFSHLKHNSRATYAQGCNGPLCRKAERDRNRERNEARALEAHGTYSPDEARRIQDAELDKIIEWHIVELHRRRLEARAERV